MKQKLRLRTVLLLLVFVAVAPGIAALVYSTARLERDELTRAQGELESVTKLAAATQEQWVDGVQQILTTVASGPSVRRLDLHALCGEFLRNVRSASPIYNNISVVDLHGKIRCQARMSNTLDRSNRRYFIEAMNTRRLAIGDYAVGATSGKKAVGFGMPVFDDTGKLSGVAIAGIDLAYPSDRLNALSLPRQLHITVSDRTGVVLATSDANRAQVGLPVADPALRAAMLRQVVASTDSHIDGVEWLHAVQPVDVSGRPGLVVAVSVRKADALTIAPSNFSTQLLIMLAASLVGFLLALLFAQRALGGPIARLLTRMRALKITGDAEPELPSETTGNLEFAELDAVFSSMLARLRTNQMQLVKAQQITRVGFYQLDVITGIYTASPIVYEILGFDPDTRSLNRAQYDALLHPDDRQLINEHRTRLFANGQPLRVQYRIVRPDGAVRWLDGFGFIEKDSSGNPLQYSGAIQDITEQMMSEQHALNTEKRFQLLYQNSLDGVLQTAPDGTIMAANAAACEIFGLTEEQLRQRGRAGIVLASDPRLAPMLQQRALTGKASGQLTMVRGDGSHFEAELTSSMYADARGQLISGIVMRDITERIKSEQHIHRLAFFDALTELPNRRLLMDRLGILLAAAQRSGHIGAVLFIDLDHFKNVNDARGHAVGDALLQQVAHRLAAQMRAEDTVARMGGDEFVVLLPDLAMDFTAAAQYAMKAAEKLRRALTQPFVIDGQQYVSGGSIGVTLLPKDQQTADDLLREADTAMYRAKQGGRNRIAFFEAKMQFDVEDRLGLENDLAQAIGTSQLGMVMQPQFDCDGKPIGAELLMRWMHPVRGAVSPAVFIPVAEASGLILELGDWVMRQGCAALLRLQQAGQLMPISINVSPSQFRQSDFVDRVRGILVESGAPASQLIFEVTEGLLIDNLDDTVLRMRELVALGIRFSIDDFGTGYSSLSYLRKLPLFELKIDISFVMDTPADAGSTAIVQSILAMAAHLDLHVVAEGVETDAQAAFLRDAGCAALQGYLFARPMQIDAWLQREPQTL